MRIFALFIAFGLLTPCTLAAQTAGQQTEKPASGAASSEQIQTEKIKVPQYMQAPPKTMANQPGYMEPPQTHALLTKLWQAEQRVKDLLTQVQPEKLGMPAATLSGFNAELDALRRNLEGLEKSRQQFDGRVDSEYLGFETYAGISQVLPPLERLTATLSRYGNLSLEGEFNQSFNDMLTMQQALKPYLTFLLRNHDQIFLTMEMNLAGCQRRVGYNAGHGQGSPKNMRNVLPDFKGRRHVNKKPETNQTAPNSK
ncbi:MAG: hypothetical protein P8Z30_14560 [Acidobacteriota bacterium]